MRKLRSLFALLLTLCLLAGISAVAFAAGEDVFFHVGSSLYTVGVELIV